MTYQPAKPLTAKERLARRGVILIAVLMALVVLSLAAYQYSDLMMAEYRASDNAHRSAQARAIADSGIHYAAAMLADPNNVTNVLNGNIWDNAAFFYDVQVPTADSGGTFGRFTLVAPIDPNGSDTSQGCRYGVTDEGGKINLNVMMQLDPSGDTLYNMLLLLPNMTTNIASSIVDWLDADSTPRDGGAEDDYYTSLSPAYHCKNGPMESLEELLLVQGVTPQLLFGNDLNHNGIIEPEEDDGSGTTALGWAPFLTVYSREQNCDPSGNTFIYLNDGDLATLYQNLSTQVDDSTAKFLILYRQYGPAGGGGSGGGSKSGASSGGSSRSSGTSSTTTGGDGDADDTANKSSAGSSGTTATSGDISSVNLDFTKSGKTKLPSIFAIINASVTVPAADAKSKPITYASPLKDPATQATVLPMLFSLCSCNGDNEIPARINVNTAPLEVLSTLPGLQTTDVQTILSTRPPLSGSEAPDPSFQTPAWLLTSANLDPKMLQGIEKYISTRSQVYRVQSIGYVDGKGPAARVEAVIDLNAGHPRIIAWRDLTPLGKGWTKPQ